MSLGRVFATNTLRATSRSGARRNVSFTPSTENPAIARAEYLSQLQTRLAAQKNKHHYDQAEDLAEASKWLKVSIMVAIPLCALSSVKDLLFGEHVHRKEGPEPDYMHIMNKDFPWECKECALFDRKCWAECRANK